jgi:hypothetical protein
MADSIEMTCPRCRQPATVRFYGPCDACRSELGTTMGGPGREVDVGVYEPKVNVVPNHVATKD